MSSSTAKPLAIDEKSKARSGDVLRSAGGPERTSSRRQSTRARAVEISWAVGGAARRCAPKPQSCTNGATVTSNAPPVRQLHAWAAAATRAISGETAIHSVRFAALKRESSDVGRYVENCCSSCSSFSETRACSVAGLIGGAG